MTKREEEIIQLVVKIVVGVLPDLKRLFLFGSRVKGKNDFSADFDFACDCKRPPIDLERKIIEGIEKVSGLYKVDVVYLDSVEPEFKKQVLNIGRVVYERRA